MALAFLSGTPLSAQDQQKPIKQLVPQQRNPVTHGLAISPYFEGWYQNSNGTYTVSFGYFNRNLEEVVYVPIGPNNFIEPAEFDGGQTTLFSPKRQRGVFTVTLPGHFAENGGRVVWTITANGVTHSVPGKIGVPAYALSHDAMALGSLPPMLKLHPDGPELWGPMSTDGNPATDPVAIEGEGPIGSARNPLQMTASIGTPLTLTVWVADRLDQEVPGRLGANKWNNQVRLATNVTWHTHQGPSLIEFSEENGPVSSEDGAITTTATFKNPGTYILRVQVDNFNVLLDSSSRSQCCWTNGYINVKVSP